MRDRDDKQIQGAVAGAAGILCCCCLCVVLPLVILTVYAYILMYQRELPELKKKDATTY